MRIHSSFTPFAKFGLSLRKFNAIKGMTEKELLERLNDIEWDDFEAKEAKS